MFLGCTLIIGSFRNGNYEKQRSAHLEFRGALSSPDGLKQKKLLLVKKKNSKKPDRTDLITSEGALAFL